MKFELKNAGTQCGAKGARATYATTTFGASSITATAVLLMKAAAIVAGGWHRRSY